MFDHVAVPIIACRILKSLIMMKLVDIVVEWTIASHFCLGVREPWLLKTLGYPDTAGWRITLKGRLI